MSEHGWDRQPIFGPPVVRQEVVEAPIQVERPAEGTTPPAVMPPQPDAAMPAADTTGHAEPDPALSAAELGMALYLLHALHAPDRPGYEHLIRDAEEGGETEEQDLPER